MVTVRGITSRTATPKFPKTDPGTRQLWDDIQPGDEVHLQINKVDTAVETDGDAYETTTVDLQEERILEVKDVGRSGSTLAGERYDNLIIFSDLDNRIRLEIASQVEAQGFSAYYGDMGWQAVNEIEAQVIEIFQENGHGETSAPNQSDSP